MINTRKSRMADHKAEMDARKAGRWRYVATGFRFRPSKNNNPAYRQSIWPEGKTANPGRMA